MSLDVFNVHAKYFDLLYKDKDYAREAAYLHALVQKLKPGAKTVLDLGCGTGKHDVCLSQLGYEVCGVDISDMMLDLARGHDTVGKVELFKGDIRTLDLGRSFDMVISLFHVLSYQNSDEDVRAMFRTASRHLVAGGIFVFDFWHGEGVLNDPPGVRIRRMEDEMIRVVRIAEPVMHKDRNVVDVHYQTLVLNKSDAQWNELKDDHSMRYFFLPELKTYLSQAGFTLEEAGEWMSGKKLSLSWDGFVVAKKKL